MGRRNLATTPAVILGMLERGLSAVEVAKRAGCTSAWVYHVRRSAADYDSSRRSTKAPGVRKASQDRRIHRALEAGATIRQAADAEGVPVDRVLALIGDVGSGRPSPELAVSLIREGLTFAETARALGVARQTVYRWVDEVRESGRAHPRRPPPGWAFVPRWPHVTLTPSTECRCEVDPILRESSFYCPICSSTGWDWHPDMKPTPVVEAAPAPEAAAEKPKAKPLKVRWTAEAREDAATLKAESRTLTRRERRVLAFGKAEADRARGLYAKLSGTGEPDQLEREGERLMRAYSARSLKTLDAELMGRTVAHPAGA